MNFLAYWWIQLSPALVLKEPSHIQLSRELLTKRHPEIIKAQHNIIMLMFHCYQRRLMGETTVTSAIIYLEIQGWQHNILLECYGTVHNLYNHRSSSFFKQETRKFFTISKMYVKIKIILFIRYKLIFFSFLIKY